MFRQFEHPFAVLRDPNGPPGGPPADPPKTEAPKSDPPADPPKPAEKTFTQAELDAVLKERLEREQKKAEKDAQKAREEAEAQALEKSKEFEKLAEQRKGKVEKLEAQLADLEPLKARVTDLEKLVSEHVTREREGLPAHIISLLDALPVEGQYRWLVANGEAVKAKPPAGVPPTPKGDDGALSEAQKQAALQRTARQYQTSY